MAKLIGKLITSPKQLYDLFWEYRYNNYPFEVFQNMFEYLCDSTDDYEEINPAVIASQIGCMDLTDDYKQHRDSYNSFEEFAIEFCNYSNYQYLGVGLSHKVYFW